MNFIRKESLKEMWKLRKKLGDVFLDRYGKKVFSSGFVRASDEDNRAAAKKSIKELYNKCIHKQ